MIAKTRRSQPELDSTVKIPAAQRILVVVGLVIEVEGFGVLGSCDGLSDVGIGEVQDAQGAILHPRNRFDAVEGLVVRGDEGNDAGGLAGASRLLKNPGDRAVF